MNNNIKEDLFYKGLTEELIAFFEHKYPLKSNKTYPRLSQDFYFCDADDKQSIRHQIQNSKYDFGMLFYMTMYIDRYEQEVTTIERVHFLKTD